MMRHEDRFSVWPRGFVLAAFACLQFAVGCGPEPAVLTVGDVGFTQSQLASVPETAMGTLIATTAIALASATDEIVQRATVLRDRTEIDALADATLREVTLASADVGDDQLRARYQTAPAHELEVRHIVFLAARAQPAALRAEARQKAEEALARARDGEDFAGLAGELSEEPGAAQRGGLLQPGREGHWVDEFWHAAQLLDTGQISPVVESTFGYHVLKLDARRVIPFEEMRDRVAAEVAALLPSEPARLLRDSVAAEIRVDLAAQDILASWPGGELSSDDFLTFVATGSGEGYRDVAISNPARAGAIQRAALAKALSIMASARGFSADRQLIDQVLSDFRTQVLGWAAILGVLGAPTPDGIAARSLAGLGATGQNATIARREMESRLPLLLTFYPVTGFTPPFRSETGGASRP